MLHLHSGSRVVESKQFIAKGQLIGKEGNTGLHIGNLDDNTHLHLEVAGQAELAWIPTSEECPGEECSDEQRTLDYDIGDMQAHYRIKSADQPETPFKGRVWYNPDDFVLHVELIPYLSRTSPSPSFEDYDVYGIADESLHGYLNLRNKEKRRGIEYH